MPVPVSKKSIWPVVSSNRAICEEKYIEIQSFPPSRTIFEGALT